MSQPPAPQPAAAPPAAPAQPKPAPPRRTAPKNARPARMRLRHFGMMTGFLLMVAAPLAATIWYLYEVAADQYASYVGFAVRSEELSSAQSLFSGLSALSGSSSSDTDILYEFIHSQTMVERVAADLDLAAMYSRPENDPVFAYAASPLIEDLLDYWRGMVNVSYATGTGLIEIRVNAFSAEDAKAIADGIVRESLRLINDLSAVAREDATEYARNDLELAIERLKTARGALTQFRSQTQIIDPMADIQGQQGILNSLEGQLAATYIDLNLLLQAGNDNDPRVEQARRRVQIITDLIDQEREKFGVGRITDGTGGQDYSTLVGEFERLSIDVRYAEDSYLAAQSGLDTAVAEAARQSRYLAIFTEPSTPDSARFPQRLQLSMAVGVALLLIWSITMLVYYSLRDRR